MSVGSPLPRHKVLTVCRRWTGQLESDAVEVAVRGAPGRVG